MPSLKHSFVCLLADDPVAAAAGEVLPSHHNAEHVLTQAAARILGRVTAGTGAVEELTAAQVKTLLAISAGDVSGLFSGAYADLTGKPTLFDGAYSSLAGLPTLGSAAAAATSDFLAANGTAALATALATPRAINGVAFDGTAAITVTAEAGTLTGTTLAVNVTASSLTGAAGGSFGSAAFSEASAFATAAQANATHTGDATGATALTLATVNGNVGSFTNASITVNAKGLVTAASSGAAGATLGANTFTAQQTTALGTIATDVQNWSGTATWNAAGVTFRALKLNVTDTASASSSMLMDLQVGGTSKFKVDKTGTIVIGTQGSGIKDSTNVSGFVLYSTIIAAQINNATIAGFCAGKYVSCEGTYVGWNGSPNDPTSAMDVALYRNGAGRLEINSGTAGTFRDLKLRDIFINGAAYLARASAALTAGGTANAPTLTTGPVTGNPTKWVAIDDAGTTRYIPTW